MKSKTIEGNAWVCDDYTDSYQILPQQYWMGGDKVGSLDPNELGKHVMENVDKDFAGKAREGQYKFIVAGKNFGGGGKSIEHPIIAIKGANIEAVIAESASRYFFRNAINNGLIILTCEGITKNVKSGDKLEVNVETGEIKNLTTNKNLKSQPLPSMIQDIISKGGYISYIKDKMKKSV
jgi:3-isopropylmalate/(R)-2-methylmalate dehydratase small subunit